MIVFLDGFENYIYLVTDSWSAHVKLIFYHGKKLGTS